MCATAVTGRRSAGWVWGGGPIPGGIDKFFAEAGEPAQRRELPPQSEAPPDVDRLIEIGKRHGILMQPMPGA
ncbi:hypothetical protein [Streptomyces sp. NPDC053048]|uniref:hypothetical protein n=1 Tax=Streptomyces sp. NPDC053048 TaxID=3365694 RepID=UPI0037CF7F77